MSSFEKRIARWVLALAVVVLAGAWSLKGQQVFGSIIGTVTDPSGSAVANAKVTITDVNKNTSFDVMTNESGQYTKGQLIPGTYRVTIEAPGFQKVVSSDLAVQVDQATQFNATLQVGNVEQTVEVTAAAPLLQTDRADVAQTFTAQQIAQLPSIGRNLQSFELLNPGTVKLGWAHAADENPQGSVQIEVNGQPFYASGYYLDGTVNQDPILGIIVINPTFDSVNEVKQANQDYDAEFDTFSAGLFTYSTKSGTNSFHGDVFDYLYVNTPGFQDFGRNPFTENTALPGHPDAFTPTTRQNQFGGSIGGRIIKDKLFFFGDAQLTRNKKGGSVLTSVPTAEDRNGILTDWLRVSPNYQIYDPATGDPVTGVGRTPFPNNVIPKGRLSPQAQTLLQYFPQPNTVTDTVNGQPVPYNNYTASGALTNNGNQWNTRWDYYGNEKNTFFGRYSYAAFDLSAPGAYGLLAGGAPFSGTNYAGSSTTLNQSVAAGWTHTANPTLINEFRFGYMRYHVTDVPNGVGSQPATDAGIPGLNRDNFYTSGLPAFYIDNPTGNQMAIGYALGINQCNCPLDQNERQYQFVDNVSKIHGNHTFKVGADIRYALNLRVPSDTHRSGELHFNDNRTGLGQVDSNGVPTGSSAYGLGLATFLLGDVTSFGRYVSSTTNAEERQRRWFFYAQDQWRATPKLTLTYGGRWDLVFPERVNGPMRGAEYNLDTGLLDVFGYGLVSGHGYQETNYKMFAPRVSIAYQITPKTVIRAGYGWSYSLGTFGSTFGHNVTQNPPVLANQSIDQSSFCGNNFCDVFNLKDGPPAPPTFQVSQTGHLPCPSGVDCKTRPGLFHMPVIYGYNLTVQRQVTSKVAVMAGYVGNQGRHQSLGTGGNNFNMNRQFFVPGYPTDHLTDLYPFNGLLGPRYNYHNTAGIDNYCNCANNRYDSFQATLTVRAAAGFNLQGNYTYQLSQGDGFGPDSSYTFLYDRKLGYVENNEFPHHQVVFAGGWDIPFGRGRKYGTSVNRLVDGVLGGWNLSGIFTYYSGRAFWPTLDNYPGQPYSGPNNIPDKGTGNPYAADKNRDHWIVGGLGGPFLAPAPNTFGNYVSHMLYGPQYVNLDASLMKAFSITERIKFTLRMDATNALNHTNLDNPNADVQSPSVGQITNIAFNANGATMRRVQFSGVVNW